MVSHYTDPSISAPIGITTGPDGALWFTNVGNNSIGRITTAGVVSNYTGTAVSEPWGITAGPDGALWFANEANSSIGRITVPPYITITPGSGPPRTAVIILGWGWGAGEHVKVGFRRTALLGTFLCQRKVAGNGTFACRAKIPRGNQAGSLGTHAIVAKAQGVPNATLAFLLT